MSSLVFIVTVVSGRQRRDMAECKCLIPYHGTRCHRKLKGVVEPNCKSRAASADTVPSMEYIHPGCRGLSLTLAVDMTIYLLLSIVIRLVCDKMH